MKQLIFERVKVNNYIFLFKLEEGEKIGIVGVCKAPKCSYRYDIDVPLDSDVFLYSNDDETKGLTISSFPTPVGKKGKILLFFDKTNSYIKPLCCIYEKDKKNIVKLTEDMAILKKYYESKKEEENKYLADEKCHICHHLRRNDKGLWECSLNHNPEYKSDIHCKDFIDITQEIKIPADYVEDFEMEKERVLYDLAVKYIETDNDWC